MAEPTHPDCFKCRHMRITWLPQQPYACAALGFRSRMVPWRVVENSSGQPCMFFQAKEPGPAGGGRSGPNSP